MRKGHARSPIGAARTLGPRGLAAAERRLLQTVDAAFARAARRAGEWLACGPGCADCCHGPFPITRVDARRLRQGLERLRLSDPDRAGAVESRARAAVRRLSPAFPGNAATGRVTEDDAALDLFHEAHAGVPCPALDPKTGRCELYEHRPVACRSFGPPLRFGAEEAPPCTLCFRGAPEEVVERCRVEPDPNGLETAILRAAGAPGDESWDTLIAFALVRA